MVEPSRPVAAVGSIIEQGDVTDDADSALGATSNASSTTSITSSIYQYRELHGRTYQATQSEDQYWAPNDEQQNDGLDIIHNMLLMVLGNKLFQAPIPKQPKKVLDVGTGTGIWAIDFGDQNPSAEVIGTDISPIQPSWVPPNVQFFIEDCNEQWTWPVDNFDFINVRALYGAVPDWIEFYKKAYKHVKPGGWIEHLEGDCRIQSDHVVIAKDHIFNRWAELIYAAGDKMGKTFRITTGHQMKEGMEKAGFIDIVERKVKVPLHGWPKDPQLKNAGFLGNLALDESLEGFGLYLLTAVLSWSKEEATVLIAQMRQEIKKKSNCAWYMRFVTLFLC